MSASRNRQLPAPDGEEKPQADATKKRAKTAPKSSKVSIPPGGGKHGRPRKLTAEQAETEIRIAYTENELQELTTFFGKGDNPIQMIADFAGTDTKTAAAILAKIALRKRGEYDCYDT